MLDFPVLSKKHAIDSVGAAPAQQKNENEEQQTQAPRPLLPHDGPLLAQQNVGQQMAGQYPMSGQDMVVVSDAQVCHGFHKFVTAWDLPAVKATSKACLSIAPLRECPQ